MHMLAFVAIYISMKRAHAGQHWGNGSFLENLESGFTDHVAGADRKEAGKQLWDLFVSEYAGGGLDAELLCSLAHFITLAGGQGVEDLALAPSKDKNVHTGNASKHLKLVLGNRFSDPDIYYCGVPSFEKTQSRRSTQQVPMMLPSTIFREALAKRVGPDDATEPLESKLNCDCEKLDKHEAMSSPKATSLHWSRRIAIALYWDGVQYTKRDTFHTLYIVNLPTRERHIVFLVSANLIYSEHRDDFNNTTFQFERPCLQFV